ncbi:prephenate dehydratase [uncultured Akkermansia sp.]|uniref:prephenate dehydratase n=1 Tax=uncultured Akkermansia sp. TaxID=512294 RepID=UPI002625A950|nr:prephenate dehydratase [uncultured Akkermansia sp.]
METTHHGEDASPDNPPRQQKSGNTDEQTIALTKARLAIDEVDARIVELLKKRAEWVHEVGRIKKEKNSPIFVPERETAMLNKLNRLNAGVLPEASLQAIYREIISCSFFLEGGLTIAYLGPKGTWSHQAALKQFGKSCELIPSQSFKDVFDMVDRGKAQYGVVPVENSSEGSVTAVMDLFVTSPLKICAQINLNIRNSLMADIPREHIRILYSHPQVLGQTRNWIQRHFPNAELVETSSTTKASILAKENAAMGAASLGCPLAAELFGLNILEEDVQDQSCNTTRFAVIGRQETQPSGRDRTSLLIRIQPKPGTLAEVVNCFQRHNNNLIRIESRPSKVINWEYVFYIDAAGHIQESPLRETLPELEQHCSMLKILGSYADTDVI